MRLALLLVVVAVAAAPARALAADAPANMQGDEGHRGAVTANLAPPLGKRWVREDIGDTFGPPIVAEGKLFVVAYGSQPSGGSLPTRLHALDAGSGATLWTQPAYRLGVAYGDGLVYAITGESTLQAFDAASGALRWTRRFARDSGLFGPPTAAAGEVYVNGSALHALKAQDGSDLWPQDGDSGTGAAAVAGDKVFEADGGGAVAYDRRLGVPLWSASGGSGGGDEEVVPVAADGRLYVAFGGDVSIFDQMRGASLGEIEGYAPAVAGGRAFYVVPGGLRAVDVETGATTWQQTIQEGPRTLPLVVGDLVLVRAGDDTLVGYDAASGTERLRSTTRITDSVSYNQIDVAGLAARGDRLVAAFPGKLIAYGPGADAPGLDPDPFRAPAAVNLRFTAPRGRLERVFGRGGVLVQGSYSRGEGVVAPGALVELQEDAWPFDEDWRTIESVEPSSSMTFRPAHPDRNARYRLRYAGVDPPALTDPLRAWVDLAIRVRYRYLSRTRLRAQIRLRGPEDALRRRTRFHFYFFRKSRNRATRIRTVRLHRRGRALVARTVMRVPLNFGRRDYVFPCYRERRPDPWGKPVDGLRFCGRKRL